MKKKIHRKRKSRAKPKPKAKTMAKKNKSEHEGDYAEPDTPEQQTVDDILPPHDPPVVPSFPQEPATGYEVDHQQKGAQPEATALRELELLTHGTRGEGPAPEPPEEAPPPEEGK